MLKKLIVYVVFILIFLIPFAASVESVMNKTQKFSIGVASNAVNRAFWVMFGELLDILEEFKSIK